LIELITTAIMSLIIANGLQIKNNAITDGQI